MYIAMNRFKVKLGSENEFVEVWRNRDSFLDEVSGFIDFHMLKGPTNENYTLFSSHTSWESKEAFEDWTKSEAFMKAHKNARKNSKRDIYFDRPEFEGFEKVL